ncbi:hypothetical protein GUJ93_ZPchr0010g7879 [Zizania palustris]|uniref:KIB1-4 beta-propeller domain-containing protein n=1 Tax=Zizania palustris TaxID=103762 RepID=A0A8J6BKL0_ZIZPA|nr:hypothetical protein GUJ93_ZPchr0010g7879 [Zizania palustris]
MEAPAPTEVPGGDLPADLLKLICHLLPCPVDRRHMGQVCRFWRRSITPEHPPPPPLPSIVLTRAGGPSFSCVFRGCITHRFKFPNDARVARYLSSYDGGWVFFTIGGYGRDSNTLINVLTGQRFMLPFLLRLQYSLYCGWHLPMVILAATLSSPPVQGHSVIAAIVSSFDDTELIGERKVAFWRLGDMNQWITGSISSSDDIIFYHGAFHVIDELVFVNSLRVYVPLFDLDGNMDHFHVEMIYFQLEDHEYDEHVTARYLVESRGELLMVVRLGQPTSSFRVFQMVQVRMPNGPITGYTWQELHALDGRALFVGRCCSRSYEVAEHAGLEDGVYFLDDGSFNDPFHDRALLQSAYQLQFRCSDSGRWSARTHQIENFFPGQGTSKYSPPVWILP